MWWIGTAFAADPSALRTGLDDPSGWVEVDRARIDGVGEVVVRHKPIAGQECLEGTTVADISPDLALRVATEVESQPSWSSWDVRASKRLNAGERGFDYYQVLDNPTPIADRVWFLRASVTREGDDRVFRWDQVDGAHAWPEAWAQVQAQYPGTIPTTVNSGAWVFRPEAGGTRVYYRICTDGGGSIPRWVGELAARSTLPTNVGDLVRETRRRAR